MRFHSTRWRPASLCLGLHARPPRGAAAEDADEEDDEHDPEGDEEEVRGVPRVRDGAEEVGDGVQGHDLDRQLEHLDAVDEEGLALGLQAEAAVVEDVAEAGDLLALPGADVVAELGEVEAAGVVEDLVRVDVHALLLDDLGHLLEAGRLIAAQADLFLFELVLDAF